MKNNKLLLKAICFALVLVFLLCFCGCGKSDEIKTKKLGSGKNNFDVVILDRKNEPLKVYEIFTDEIMLGNALAEHNLIKMKTTKSGVEYLYSIDGIKADMEKDNEYWNFTENTKPVRGGIFNIAIQCDSTYIFKIVSTL